MRFCENFRVRMAIIDNLEIKLYFQLHICNPLFENAVSNNVF